MKPKETILLFPVLLLILIVGSSCNKHVDHSLRQTYTDVNTIIDNDSTEIDIFKVHLNNGDIGVLDSWDLNSTQDSIVGQGKLYDFNLEKRQVGDLAFSIDDVSFIENQYRIKQKGKIGVEGAIILFCLKLILVSHLSFDFDLGL